MKKTFITLAIGSATVLSGANYQQNPQGSYQQGQPYQGQNYQRQGNQWQQGQPYDQGQYYYNYNQGQGNQWQQGQPYDQGQYSCQRPDNGWQQDQPYNQGQYNNNQGQGNQWQQQGRPYNQGQANFQNPQNPNQSNKQGSPQDREIEKKIGETITGGWFSKGYNTVSYQVNNGKVILKGTIDTEENKSQVEDNVSRLPGVVSVDNQIRVVAKSPAGEYDEKALNDSESKYPNDTTTTESDRQINAKIREKLGSWVSKGYNEAIILRTDNGLVIVVGTVKNSDDIQKVVDQIKKVEGVRKINSQLSVKR